MKTNDDAKRTFGIVSTKRKERGPNSAGQSGDMQGLEGGRAEELLEEGQTLEAEILMGIEDAPDADEGEVRTKQVPDDDVPTEYLGRD
jgi:hypothetical protein